MKELEDKVYMNSFLELVKEDKIKHQIMFQQLQLSNQDHLMVYSMQQEEQGIFGKPFQKELEERILNKVMRHQINKERWLDNNDIRFYY